MVADKFTRLNVDDGDSLAGDKAGTPAVNSIEELEDNNRANFFHLSHKTFCSVTHQNLFH